MNTAEKAFIKTDSLQALVFQKNALMQERLGPSGTSRICAEVAAGSSVIFSYQRLPQVYPVENVEEDSTEDTIVLSPSNQTNQIITKALNYLPHKAPN